jgi:hypothetical protein
MTTDTGHGIACCCNDCLDRQVATVMAEFGPKAGEEQRRENDRLIRTKAEFWDALFEAATASDACLPDSENSVALTLVDLVTRYADGKPPTDQSCTRPCRSFGTNANGGPRNDCAGVRLVGDSLVACTCRCHPENR